MIGFLMDGLVSWLADRVLDLLGGLLSYLTSGLFLSPDVTALPPVTAIAGKSALVVDTCYVLAFITAGIVIMTSSSMQIRYGVKEFAPRLVVAFILSNVAIPLCRTLIEVANALTTAMVGTAAPTTQAVAMTRAHVIAAMQDPASGIIAVIIGVLVVGLMFTLMLTWIVRVAVLVVLAGVAPVALACYCLPYTQPAAALWWRSLLGCLGTATLQAVAFSAGIQVLIDPAANFPVLIGVPGSDIVNLLMVAALLWLTVKIPGLMRRYVTRSGGGVNVASLVLRTVAIQSVTRGLPIPGVWRRAGRGGR